MQYIQFYKDNPSSVIDLTNLPFKLKNLGEGIFVVSERELRVYSKVVHGPYLSPSGLRFQLKFESPSGLRVRNTVCYNLSLAQYDPDIGKRFSRILKIV